MKQSISSNPSPIKALYKTESGDFDAFMKDIKDNIPTEYPLFSVDTKGLWDEYLFSFDYLDRQEYNCRCCRKFIEDFGGLVYITNAGQLRSALWNASITHGYFKRVVSNMQMEVLNRGITHQVFSNDKFLGRPIDGGWTHLAIPTPRTVKSSSVVKTPSQVSAERTEDFKMLSRAISRYDSRTINKAITLLRSDMLIRSEKVLPHAEWFLGLLDRVRIHHKYRDNILWSAVASAPTGFAHVNGSTLGLLLSDISGRLSDANIAKRFNKAMDPLRHNRPQTAPGAQNIKRGEEIIAQMGLERSLERRHARLDDLDLLWKPTPKKASQASSEGIFSNITPRSRSEESIQNVSGITTMTFSKFARKILPTADKVLLKSPAHGNYSALVTATHPDAPNLLQWSNPVNWYVYSGGSKASQWNMSAGKYIEVTGITLQPNMWDNECEHQGEGVFFLLEGCRDSRNAGLALFPEVLKSELREVRKTIEAYSNKGKLTGKSESSASGIKFNDKSSDVLVKVISNNVSTTYKLDRME